MGLSVSRVGGAAQIKAIRQVAGQLRIELSQYNEMKVFAQFGSDLDASTRDLLSRGERLTQILKQDRYSPLPEEEQALLLFVMTRSNLITSMQQTMQLQRGLCDYLRQQYPHILSDIARKAAITEETAALIPGAVQAFLAAQEEKQS